MGNTHTVRTINVNNETNDREFKVPSVMDEAATRMFINMQINSLYPGETAQFALSVIPIPMPSQAERIFTNFTSAIDILNNDPALLESLRNNPDRQQQVISEIIGEAPSPPSQNVENQST